MALERKYSAELKAEALAMVDELREHDPGNRSAVRATAAALGVGEQSLRSWLKTREKREAQLAARAAALEATALPSRDDDSASASDDLEREVVYLRGECARLRAAITALITT